MHNGTTYIASPVWCARVIYYGYGSVSLIPNYTSQTSHAEENPTALNNKARLFQSVELASCVKAYKGLLHTFFPFKK